MQFGLSFLKIAPSVKIEFFKITKLIVTHISCKTLRLPKIVYNLVQFTAFIFNVQQSFL